MLFNKYQYSNENISKRGYSQTCEAQDENGEIFWIKWILGIEKSSTKAKILADKLRHLQKARHAALPEIIEYGYDEEQQTFAIVFKFLNNIDTLENSFTRLKSQSFISGLIELAGCLNELHQKFKINHGDIQPANILVDNNGEFFLIDFGLSDITRTLSQEKDLEIFAKEFAAPEKLNRLVSKGFPYQSDIYSFGKILGWFFHERQEIISEEQNKNLQHLLAENPNDRPNWQQVIDFLKDFLNSFEQSYFQISFNQRNCSVPTDFWEEINNTKPLFDVRPSEKDDYFMNIIIGKYFCESSIWIKSERKLLINNIQLFDTLENNIKTAKKRDSKPLPYNYVFTENYQTSDNADPAQIFQKWFVQNQSKHSLRENRKAVKEELSFYRELLEKEKEVIAKHSLRLQYDSYKVNGNEIVFNIKPNEKYSSQGVVLKHIEEGNDVNSDGFEYVVSANADRKQNKEVIEFAGKPYDWVQKKEDDKLDVSERKYALKIKDCEHLRKDKIPQSGFLFENTAKKEEEKNRQLDAIRKVEKNEVQNPDLIYHLFKPDDLPISSSDYSPLERVWQKDKDNQPLVYSDNQNKAIRNSLTKSPFSIIQGPPGTGKTTVITEIVFQILAQKPEAKILITSQTNNAVDQVLENLLKNNISILRLSGITAPKVPSIREHTMDRKLSGWKKQVRETAEKNFKTKQEQYKSLFGEQVFVELQELHRDWITTITALDEKSAINQKLIDSIRVIGATCNHIAAKKYSKYNFEFDYVIMDESGKATIAEALVPIVLGKNLVFVGDHRQLRPMLTSTKEVESWLREKYKKEADALEESFEDYFNRPSLFEQVITKIDEDYKAQLDECRRSSKEQVLLTSQCFYEPEGDEEIKPIKRETDKEHNLPLSINSSIIFVDLGSHYKNEVDNKSSYNKESARLIPEILELLNKYDKVKEYSFGVITGYTAQYRKLKNKIKGKELKNIRKWGKDKPEEKLTVSVVDRFQGLERDIVIMDLVKSGTGLNLGFLETPNRINVALSRQKRLLIIVGDYSSIVNAKTRSGEKVALQRYLEKIKPEWIIKAEQINELFFFKNNVAHNELEETIEEKEVAFIETKVEKLDGVKIVGKIDFDSFSKKKAQQSKEETSAEIPKGSIDIEKLKTAIINTYNPITKKFELSSLNNTLRKEIQDFDYHILGFEKFKDFCLSLSDVFDIETSDNGTVYIIPKFDYQIEYRDVDNTIMELEKIKKAATKSWNPEIQKIELNTFFNALVQEVKHFTLKNYGYSNFKDLCVDYGFNIENSDDGKIYLIPTFDFEKPTHIKPKRVLPIPIEKAVSVFHTCEKDENGLVNTKDYYQALRNAIKGFNPLVYGGRFNDFYKKMNVFEIIVQDKDTKFLKLKEE
ncbi:MAG: protein kinase [Bacteroidales bacterium]|jgi:superfamily I DNA and/or RNA helicase|nr:protein kinase [Bacteroidales bacterium]